MPQPYGPDQESGADATTMSRLLGRLLPRQRRPVVSSPDLVAADVGSEPVSAASGAGLVPADEPIGLAPGEAVILAGDAATARRIRMCLDVAGISAAVLVLAPSGQLEGQGDPVE
ncbi:hypothetical protein ACN27F_23210 [Solwaraspora sp. WMMB335]|uniref:hypothetical protein n=1 Tax=Solwaraspora sp. WMMB335 TaxID=3404118 RepID=UPI003B9344EB